MGFKTIGTVIKSSSLISPKSADAIAALQIRQVAQDVIKKNCADLPGEVLGLIKVNSVKKGVLTVGCPSLVAAELSMRSDGLIEDINRTIGKKILFSIKFRII